MQFVSSTKFAHNWWPSIIPFKKEDETKISLVLFCLGGSYTNKCEILFFQDKLKPQEEKKDNTENINNEENKEEIKNNEENKNDVSIGGEEVRHIDDKIIPLKWYQIASTGVNHGQAGSFILNNK